MRHIKNKRGSGIVEFIIIVTVVALLAIGILPQFNDSTNSLVESSVKVLESNDTSSE